MQTWVVEVGDLGFVEGWIDSCMTEIAHRQGLWNLTKQANVRVVCKASRIILCERWMRGEYYIW